MPGTMKKPMMGGGMMKKPMMKKGGMAKLNPGLKAFLMKKKKKKKKIGVEDVAKFLFSSGGL